MTAIRTPCSRDHFPAYRTSGTRPLRDVKLIVLHSTESPPGSAGAVAAYFHSKTAEGSAHLVVDDLGCQRCLPDTAIPWAAANANENGFHIEQCGYAAWDAEQWEHHLPMLHRVAYKVAQAGHRFDIPLKHLTASDLGGNRRGVTTHRAVSRYSEAHNLPGDHSHTDPGEHYPIDLLLHLATHYRNTL